MTIGEAEGDDVYLFQSVAAARFLGDGRIVVADRGLHELRIYSSEGKFQRRLGRRGEGPGEFSQVGGMWLTSEGSIAVWDAANRRITTFGNSDWRHNTKRIIENPPGGNLEVFFGTFANNDIVLASLFPGRRGAEMVPDPWSVGRFGADGSFKRTLTDVNGMWRFNGYAVPFSPMPFIAVYGDSLYIADGYAAEIVVHDGSGMVARTMRLPPLAGFSDAIWSSLEDRVR
ncbi:MAG: 6-bladed beta-propeller, partial [Candidatus Binatia bacterium]